MTFKDHPEFTPDYTPQQVLAMGAFGGAYFRPIYSTVLGQALADDYLQFPWANRIATTLLVGPYNPAVNHYGVACGTSLQLWESKGWIHPADPRGWFQWYCRFYQGRRIADDQRQIKRWLAIAGPKGRFNRSRTPIIRQTLLHWATK